MDAAHLHLMLNHFPLIGFVFSILILVLGFYLKNENTVRVGFLIVLISGVLAAPTYLTGEDAEDIIEKLPNFSEHLVEAHEEAAESTIWFIGVTTLAAAAGLWLSIKRNVTTKSMLMAVIILNLISLVVIGRTSNLGGQISHPEIRDSNE